MGRLTKLEVSYISKKIQIKSDTFVVLIDTTERILLQEKLGMKNIFCIDSNNKIIWQVFIDESEKSNLKDTFMYVDLSTPEELNADTFFGIEYKIDIKTGKAIRVGWHK